MCGWVGWWVDGLMGWLMGDGGLMGDEGREGDVRIPRMHKTRQQRNDNG